MFSKLSVLCAIGSFYALRIIRILSWLALAIFALLLGGVWALAHFVSAWWWLLLIPFVMLLVLFVVIRIVARLIAKGLSRQQLTTEQRQLLGDYVEKIERLLEKRGTSLPLVTLVSIKDLLFYRELRTINQLINDSVTLKRDFSILEEELNTTKRKP